VTPKERHESHNVLYREKSYQYVKNYNDGDNNDANDGVDSNSRAFASYCLTIIEAATQLLAFSFIVISAALGLLADGA